MKENVVISVSVLLRLLLYQVSFGVCFGNFRFVLLVALFLHFMLARKVDGIDVSLVKVNEKHHCD